jgi:hypothetical protein
MALRRTRSEPSQSKPPKTPKKIVPAYSGSRGVAKEPPTPAPTKAEPALVIPNSTRVKGEDCTTVRLYESLYDQAPVVLKVANAKLLESGAVAIKVNSTHDKEQVLISPNRYAVVKVTPPGA